MKPRPARSRRYRGNAQDAAAPLSVSAWSTASSTCSGDECGIGIKNVTVNEPQFLGHFPGNPVFPGVLMIEGMAQTAGVLCIAAISTERPKIGLFPDHRQGEVPQAGRAGRHDRVSRDQNRAAQEHVVVSRRGQGRRPARRRSRSRRHDCRRMSAAMIDPTARIEAGAVIGQDVAIGPYCVVGPHVVDRRRLPAARACPSHRPYHDRRAHRDLSVRLARHAAAIGALSRRADAARDRRRLRHPRKRHDEYRHRGRRRRHAGRRPLLPDGRLACRARLPGRQRCHVRQQRGARRPCQVGDHVVFGGASRCISSCGSARAR